MSFKTTISEFSPDGKLFALIDEHGILKIWDTETSTLKQEYAPNLHLSSPCTCFTWLVVNKNVKLKKSKKYRNSLENTEPESGNAMYLVFGTSHGTVSLYSFALGKVERNLKGEGHNGPVTCLIFDGNDALYTGGEDCNIICWSISHEKRVACWSIGNEKPRKLEYLPNSNKLVIGAKELKVFSLEEQEILDTHIGHTSDVILLKGFVSGSTEYCLSASKNERVISVWTLKGKSKYRTSTATLLMEDIAYDLSLKFDENDKNLKISAVTRSGVIHIFCVDLDSLKADKPIKPKTTIQIVSDSQTIIEPIMAITASLEHGSKNKSLLFAYGDTHILFFESIEPKYSEHIEVLIRSDHKKSLQKPKQVNEAITKTISPQVSHGVHYQATAIPVDRKKRNDIQIPLETRLQNLYVSNGEIPSAQSKVQLLIQSLHSQDKNLLYTVLSTDESKVITLTLQKLPVQYISPLVNELTLLMEQKQMNVQIAASWLKELIKIHSSQLMALGTDDLLKKFGPCLGIIEHRTSCLPALSKLSGRLQLLISQIKRSVEEDTLHHENCLVYDDDSDADVKPENIPIKAESISDINEWEDENMEEDETEGDNVNDKQKHTKENYNESSEEDEEMESS